MAGFVDEERPLVRLLRRADDSEADERDNSDRLTKIAESLGCRPPNPPMRNLTFDYRQGFALRESWSSKASPYHAEGRSDRATSSNIGVAPDNR